MDMAKTMALLGVFDAQGAACGFVKRCLEQRGPGACSRT
jgi:hypothetical protein